MNPVAPLSSPVQVERSASPVQVPKEVEAARQFEAIFVRKLLSCLEKTQSLGSEGSTGSSIYGSMMVGSLADVITQGPGLGLAALVLEALTPADTAVSEPTTDPAAAQKTP